MSDKQPIAVIGGGSLGLFLAGHLSLAGKAVTVAQRSSTPIPEGGIIAEGDEHWQAPAVQYATLESLQGPFQQIIVAVKSHDLPEILPRLSALGDANSQYVFLQNGVPWWWRYQDGQIAGAPPLAQIVAAVVYHAVERTAPGRIQVRRVQGDRYAIARTQGGSDTALAALISQWQQAGIPTELSADIRRDLWTKLMGNATLNPMSAITGGGMSDMASNPRVRAVLLAGMAEISRIAAHEGSILQVSPEARVKRAEEVGNTRTSMLQDRLAGRRLELDALLAAPIALAEAHGEPVPVLRTLLGSLALSRPGDPFVSAY